jgi:hypothetical protein
MPRSVRTDDPYTSTVIKFIPTEIVAGYLAIQGFITGLSEPALYWVILSVSAALLVLCPLYLAIIQKVKTATQLIVTAISFVVWLYTLGGPFTYWGIHDPRIGAAILVIWTLILPLVVKPRE